MMNPECTCSSIITTVEAQVYKPAGRRQGYDGADTIILACFTSGWHHHQTPAVFRGMSNPITTEHQKRRVHTPTKIRDGTDADEESTSSDVISIMIDDCAQLGRHEELLNSRHTMDADL